jgi:copper chaperone CopZ
MFYSDNGVWSPIVAMELKEKRLMTRTIALASVLAVAAGCAEQPAATNESDTNPSHAISFNAAGAPTVEFSLPSLVCDDEECALAVKDILARQPGAKDVRVDVEAKTAMVAIDDGKFNSRIALAELGDKGFHLELRAAADFKSTSAPTVEFSVPDMMCEEGCAAAVREILAEQPGVKDVLVDFDAKLATVAIDEGRFDSQSALAELVDKGFMNSTLNALTNDVPGTRWTSYPPGTRKQTVKEFQSETEEKNGAAEEGLRTKGT